MKKIFIFLFDGFSDWEIAFLTPEIRKSSNFQIVYFSKNGKPVSSMGGLHVSPETSLTAIHPGDVEMLILPGGKAWEKGENDFMDTFVKSVFNNGKTVAAICAATAFLGNKGFLNELKHTSNDLYYLKAVAPLYSGEQHYIGSLAVSDQNLITANGVAPIEFAREILRKLNLYNETNIEKWFQLFKNGIWSE